MRAHFEEGGAGGSEPPTPVSPARPLLPALLAGCRGRCPACGTGRLFDGFLTVRRVCEVCGEELHHHRADDLPPYLTIFLVGHVVVTGLLVTDRMFEPPVWLEMAIWLPVTALLALALLRPIKGAVVGLQWSLRMHGFGRLPPSPFPRSAEAR